MCYVFIKVPLSRFHFMCLGSAQLCTTSLECCCPFLHPSYLHLHKGLRRCFCPKVFVKWMNVNLCHCSKNVSPIHHGKKTSTSFFPSKHGTSSISNAVLHHFQTLFDYEMRPLLDKRFLCINSYIRHLLNSEYLIIFPDWCFSSIKRTGTEVTCVQCINLCTVRLSVYNGIH